VLSGAERTPTGRVGESRFEVIPEMKGKLVRILASVGSLAAMIVAGAAVSKIG